MIKAKDIVSIKFNPKWFKSGLEYALKSWTSTFNRMGKPNPYTRLQKIIIGIIAENALEYYLIDNGIPYETNGKTKWYEEDRYDIGINDYALDVKASFLDLNSEFIIRRLNDMFVDKYDWFVNCHALVPLDQFNPGKNKRRVHKRDKAYIFPFVEGCFINNEKNDCLVHTFWDYKWLKKGEYIDLQHLGKIKIQYDGDYNASGIKLYGTTDKKEICVETIKLNERILYTTNNFYQIFSIQWFGKKPSGVLKIQSKALGLEEIIKPKNTFILKNTENGYQPLENNWQNISIYDCSIYLLGWIHEESMRVEGQKYPRFTHTIGQYSETKVDNWGCLISQLNPMKNIKQI